MAGRRGNRARGAWHAALFCLSAAAGIRLLLPSLLDTPLAALALGLIPAGVLFLTSRALCRALSLGPGWFPAAAAGLGAIPALGLISPPQPWPVLLAAAAGGVALFAGRRSSLAAFLCALLLAALLLPRHTRPGFSAPRLVVIGIDALDHGVVTERIRRGALPNLARLIAEGASGPFATESPTFSPILWTTIATGRGPDEHGIDGFYNTADDLRVRRLWDILEGAGWRTGVYRWLVTWPPSGGAGGGFRVPDIFARDARALPPEYGVVNAARNRVKGGVVGGAGGPGARETAGYAAAFLALGVRGSTLLRLATGAAAHSIDLIRDGRERYLLLRRVEMELNTDLFLELVARRGPRFAAFYDNGVDMVGHRLWATPATRSAAGTDPMAAAGPGTNETAGEEAPGGPIDTGGPAVERMYDWTDAMVGRLRAAMPESCRFALVSDHGQRGVDAAARAAWFVHGDRVLDALGLGDRIYVTVLGSFSYLFSARGAPPDSVARIVSAELPRIRLTAPAGPLLTVRRDEGTGLPFLDLARHGLEGTEAVSIDGDTAPLDRFLGRGFRQMGEHDTDGTIILAGPGFRHGVGLAGAGLRDLVPTLLHAVGLPVARDMTGRVLLEAFRDPRPIRTIDTWETETRESGPGAVDVDSRVKERLRTLGYVD